MTITKTTPQYSPLDQEWQASATVDGHTSYFCGDSARAAAQARDRWVRECLAHPLPCFPDGEPDYSGRDPWRG